MIDAKLQKCTVRKNITPPSPRHSSSSQPFLSWRPSRFPSLHLIFPPWQGRAIEHGAAQRGYASVGYCRTVSRFQRQLNTEKRESYWKIAYIPCCSLFLLPCDLREKV